MRVLSVVTLVSPDGAYGGPTRVALNLAAELARRDVEVEVTAGTRGFDEAPTAIAGVPVRLFRAVQLIPKSGFAGVAAPGQAWWFLRNWRRFDVVHVHLARDLVTPIIAGIALILRKPVFVQTHGMIDPSDKKLSIPFDLLLIRPILRRATAVFCLTDHEASDVAAVEQDCRIVILPNGVPDPEAQLCKSGEPPSRGTRVLYLARLAKRKRPLVFVRSAISVLAAGGDASFALVGPDEGEADSAVRAAEDSAFAPSIVWEGPLEPSKTLVRMAESDLYVLPAIDEPFPMSVLEAMSIGLPVIVTDSCGLAEAVERAEAGIVVDDSEEALASAMRRYLGDPELLIRHGENARRLVSESFSMSGVGNVLVAEYQGGMT